MVKIHPNSCIKNQYLINFISILRITGMKIEILTKIIFGWKSILITHNYFFTLLSSFKFPDRNLKGITKQLWFTVDNLTWENCLAFAFNLSLQALKVETNHCIDQAWAIFYQKWTTWDIAIKKKKKAFKIWFGIVHWPLVNNQFCKSILHYYAGSYWMISL